ncbi:hypothetical protein BRETT_001279 [Brettanomyces bruxellensis]|uniref:RNA polymerase II subunit A C-terminal domain phosphatase n=1 Tax=Dekkera bruxellensis TaxID=5007 RepID=A0A871RBL1_DEKBR|nr:uncharacterized protein BRETT_001279 [Brettanomyces bruxellensis]QOU21555.1 hypothetical protein BRETT_001279 [Brettanomyces bruxellensis]
MQDSTSVYLPSKLPYPLKVGKIMAKEGEDIDKRTKIFTYRYSDYEPVPLSKQDQDDDNDEGNNRKKVKVEYVGTYECPLAGTIKQINVKPDDIIEDSSKSIIEIVEPCTHPIQYGGLCALCGKAVDEDDYTGFKDKDRAPISMAHGTTNLKVSAKEAVNIEKGSTERLIKDKKLSLVVDLDQTVIHATVDPTVGEWMNDPTNPNYEALKEVKSFSLEEPAIVPPGYNGPPLPPNIRWYYIKLRPGLHEFLEKVSKLYEMHIYTMATRSYAKEISKIIDPDGIYFGDRILSRDESGSLTQKSLKRLFPVDTSMVVVIDDRGDVWNWSPNLIKVVPYDFFVGIGDINSSFLPRQQALLGPSKRRKSVDILEEKMHGDDSDDGEEDDDKKPDPKKLMAEAKASSTTESAIDDEDDVDTNSMSEGDIKNGYTNNSVGSNNTGHSTNSANDKSFNPDFIDADIMVEDESTQKIENPNKSTEQNTQKSLSLNTAKATKITSEVDSKTHGSQEHSNHVNVSVKNSSSSPVERMVELGEGEDNGELLAMQANERSTALEQQQQERPLAKLQQNLEKILQEEETKDSSESSSVPSVATTDERESHNLLCDDDTELQTLGKALTKIHDKFYLEKERDVASAEVPDVKDIMNTMKSVVFQGCVFLLSGILPLGTPLDSADIVIWARSYGAQFVSEYSTSVTHVICKNPTTFKVRLAKSVDPNVQIVNPDWLFKCMSMWRRVPEEDYTVQVTSLMGKEQVDNFLKYHNHIDNNPDGTFDTSNLDWDEIDEEMREFMGPEYDELESDSDTKEEHENSDVNNESNGIVGSEEKKDAKATDDGSKDSPSLKSDLSDMSEDEYEKQVLGDLADLEEEGEEGSINTDSSNDASSVKSSSQASSETGETADVYQKVNV